MQENNLGLKLSQYTVSLSSLNHIYSLCLFQVKEHITILLSTFFYLGKMSVAPGTFGTLGAIPLYYILIFFLDKFEYLFVTIIIVVLSVILSNMAAKVFDNEDPNEVVIDEVAGFLTTMVLIPFSVINVVAAFMLFRFFDITKPFPARQLEGLGGGLGIVMDDIAAGIWANICLQLLVRYIF